MGILLLIETWHICLAVRYDNRRCLCPLSPRVFPPPTMGQLPRKKGHVRTSSILTLPLPPPTPELIPNTSKMIPKPPISAPPCLQFSSQEDSSDDFRMFRVWSLLAFVSWYLIGVSGYFSVLRSLWTDELQ